MAGIRDRSWWGLRAHTWWWGIKFKLSACKASSYCPAQFSSTENASFCSRSVDFRSMGSQFALNSLAALSDAHLDLAIGKAGRNEKETRGKPTSCQKPETPAANHNNIARKINNMACIGPWSVTKSTGKKSHTGKRCENNFWIMGIGNTHMILDIHKHMRTHIGTCLRLTHTYTHQKHVCPPTHTHTHFLHLCLSVGSKQRWIYMAQHGP